MALSKSHCSQAIMQLFTCFSATIEKNLIGPKPVYQKPRKLHLQLYCCLPLYENMATCLMLKITQLSVLLQCARQHAVCHWVHLCRNAFFAILCFPSGKPVTNYLWRMIKCDKKEGLDPYLFLPCGHDPRYCRVFRKACLC